MLAAGPSKGRDARWRSTLGTLADPQFRLPEPERMPEETGPTVTAPCGVTLPRRPVWQSPNGPELTLPPGVSLRPESHIERVRREIEQHRLLKQ